MPRASHLSRSRRPATHANDGKLGNKSKTIHRLRTGPHATIHLRRVDELQAGASVDSRQRLGAIGTYDSAKHGELDFGERHDDVA